MHTTSGQRAEKIKVAQSHAFKTEERGKTNIPYLAQESDFFSVCYLLSRKNIHIALEDHSESSLDSYLCLIVGLL